MAGWSQRVDTASATVRLRVVAVPRLGIWPSTNATTGSFAVSPSGSATYSIPIQVPPGTAGMQPALSLSYNSQDDNGLLGMGWSITGLSAISRCGGTIVQDGARTGVNLDAGDKFCLDGQRLMALNAGTYFQNGQTYGTEIESFVRVSAIGTLGNGPASFTVETKSGQKSFYSAVTLPGQTTPYMWVVSTITDKLNNCMTFSYGFGAAGDEFYPTAISYSGRFNGSTCTDTYNSVQFIPDATLRTDVNYAYVGGGKAIQKQRIKTIRTLSPMPAGVTASWVKEYRLDYGAGYAPATGHSRLQSVEECEGVGLGWVGLSAEDEFCLARC